MAEVSGIKTGIKLFRPNRRPNNPNIIQANLQPLMHNTKKSFAQAMYYQNHPEHQSPLKRYEKGPVHQRLGLKQDRLRKRVSLLGTSTMSVLPKKRMPKNYNNMRSHNTPHHFRRLKFSRQYSAQARLERIRAHQTNNSVIKLKRLNGLQSPKNLTVEVQNSNFISGANGVGPSFARAHKFKMIIDESIRAEIAELQRETRGLQVTIPPTTTVTPVTTTLTTSERFSML